MAHSAIDFREPAALAVAGAVSRGHLDGLADQAATLDATPGPPGAASAVEGDRRGGHRRGRAAARCLLRRFSYLVNPIAM